MPGTSVLNAAPGQVVENLTMVAPGTGGAISLFNNKSNTNVTVDLVGYLPSPVPAQDFVAVQPARLLDTRNGGGAQNGTLSPLTVTGIPTIPIPSTGVGAVALNITTVNPSQNGFVTAWGTGTTAGNAPPTATQVSFNSNIAVSQSFAIVPVGNNGQISLNVNSTGTSNVVDVMGWFPGTAAGYPSAGNCSSTAPALGSGTDAGIPGTWWDPTRSGTSWQFNFVSGGFIATWLTFDSLNRPVWLTSGGIITQQQIDPVTGDQEYLLPLNQVQRLIGATGYSYTPAGSVAVTFTKGSAVSAAVRWQWNAAGNAPQLDECVYNFFQSPQAGLAMTGNPIDSSYTGEWYSPGQSGWGIAVTVNGTFESDAVTIFDVAGNPVWLYGTLSNPTTASQQVPLAYVKGTGYPAGFPTTPCSSNCKSEYTATNNKLTRTFTLLLRLYRHSDCECGLFNHRLGRDVQWPNLPISNPATITAYRHDPNHC